MLSLCVHIVRYLWLWPNPPNFRDLKLRLVLPNRRYFYVLFLHLCLSDLDDLQLCYFRRGRLARKIECRQLVYQLMPSSKHPTQRLGLIIFWWVSSTGLKLFIFIRMSPSSVCPLGSSSWGPFHQGNTKMDLMIWKWFVYCPGLLDEINNQRKILPV